MVDMSILLIVLYLKDMWVIKEKHAFFKKKVNMIECVYKGRGGPMDFSEAAVF